MKLRAIFYTILALMISATGAYAQLENNNFSLTKSVMDAGGRDARTLSRSFELMQSSLGQTAIGVSESRHEVSAVGNAQIDTAKKAVGISSALFDGNGDYLTTPDSDDWNLGTKDFTIDVWVRFNSVSVQQTIVGQVIDGSNYWRLWFDNAGSGTLVFDADGKNMDIKYSNWNPSINTWYHIEFVRLNGICNILIDGDLKTLTTNTSPSYNLQDLAINFFVGGQTGVAAEFNGWIDELKIKKAERGNLETVLLISAEGEDESTEFLDGIINFTLYGGYLTAPPAPAEPGQILMDVTGLVSDLTKTNIHVGDITAVVDGQDFTAYDVPVTEGPATIHLTAADEFNQITDLDVNFTLDVTPPTRPTLNPVTTPVLVSPQTISGTKEINTSMRMFKDGQESEILPLDAQTTWSYALNLNEGENPFQIFAKDQAGNESTRVDGSIYLDVYRPKLAIVYPSQNTTVNQPGVNVLGIVEDDETTVKLIVNGAPAVDAFVENRAFTVSNVLLHQGLNILTAEANSPGDLRNSVSVSVYYQPNANVPASPVLNPVTSPTNQNTQVISGTKPLNTYLWLNASKLGNGFFSKTTWSSTLNLQELSNPLLLFVKDNASPYPNVSPAVASTIFYDATAPTRPLVIDDGFLTNSTTSLHAKWVSDDPQTAIVDNQYAIGITPGGEDLVPFTSVGTANEVTVNNLSLQQGQTYYFTVITTNEAGSQSAPGYSDGIRVNGSVPRIIDVSLADLSKLYQGTNNVLIAVTAEDKDGDNLIYRFSIDGHVVQNWSSDSDYAANVRADDFGRKVILVEVADMQNGQPVGGSDFRNIRVFVVKRPIDAP